MKKREINLAADKCRKPSARAPEALHFVGAKGLPKRGPCRPYGLSKACLERGDGRRTRYIHPFG